MLSAIWQNLKPVMVIWYGSHLAGMFALFLERLQGATWQRAGMVAALVACIAGILLAVVALWGIRYPVPQVVEHVHTVKPDDGRTVVQRAAPVYDDLLYIPRDDEQSYQATMARRKPAPDIAMSEPQLARVVMYLLDGDGIASARRLAHICTPPETRKVRSWLMGRRWAYERNKTAVVNDQGRAGLVELLPHLARE
jgi:hypothetical protein